MKSIGTVKLETKRLILRRQSVSDADMMFNNWANDPRVTKYLTWKNHENVELTKKLLGMWEVDYSNLDYYQWGIVLKENNQMIGNISAISIDKESESVSIGYCIGYNYWNQGYTSEAFKEVIRFLFEEVKVKSINAYHCVANINSGKVMTKCGMKLVGNSEHLDNEGKLCLCDDYQITIEEYKKTRS